MSSNVSDQSVNPPSPVNGPMVLVALVSLVFVVILVVGLHLYARYVLHSRGGGGGRRLPRLATVSIFVRGGEPAPLDLSWTGLEPNSIAALPTFAYNKGSADLRAGEDCAVCISVLEEGEMVRMLPNCMHVFHVPCIDKWLLSRTTCPVCRSPVEPAATVEVGEASAPPPPPQPLQGAVGSKEVGSTSALGSSFRRIMSWEWSGRRVQGDGVDDLERQQ